MSDVSEIQASSELVQALQKSKLLDDLYANPKTKGPLLSILKERFKAKYGSDDEELNALLENEVKKDGVQNLDTAMELRRHRAAAAPRNTQSSPILIPDSKELFADPRGWGRREALRAVEDFRKGKLY